MRYLLNLHLDERLIGERSPSEIQAGMALHIPYIERLRRNGQYHRSGALALSEQSRTVLCSQGVPVVTDGPFAETREQLGGFYVVSARDLDEAIAIASDCPALRTVAVGIEIRPITVDVAPAGVAGFLLAIHREETGGDDAVLARWGASVLAPAGSATSLRLREGRVSLSDGPYAEVRPPLAAIRMVSASDLEAAVALALDCPAGDEHAIEVRPIRSS